MIITGARATVMISTTSRAKKAIATEAIYVRTRAKERIFKIMDMIGLDAHATAGLINMPA
jgi:hypothetical protein